MLNITTEDMIIPKSNFEFSLHEDSDHKKIADFIKFLGEKINLSPTLEKVSFFHIFKYYVMEDDVDFHYKTKKRFLRRFFYNQRGDMIQRKQYSYIDPTSLSLYVPEFYETINHFFEGDDVNLPVFEKTIVSPVSKENKEVIDEFWESLNPICSKLLLEPSENFITLLLIKFLKDGGDNIPVYDKSGFFYSAFRKVDVLENDIVYLVLNDDKLDKSSRKKYVSKDAIVWNIINPFIRNIKQNKKILINNDFKYKLQDIVSETIEE